MNSGGGQVNSGGGQVNSGGSRRNNQGGMRGSRGDNAALIRLIRNSRFFHNGGDGDSGAKHA